MASELWTELSDVDSPLLRSCKRLIGIALLPLCWILFETFVVLLRTDTFVGDYWKSRESAFFGLGALLALMLFFLCRGRALMWIYVAGHELTHVIFVYLCRGKLVKSPHISASGGYIVADRTNFLISLSPYFFPFYSVCAIIAWMLIRWVLTDHQQPDTVWLFGALGLTWTFHLAFTFWMLGREQSDVTQNGRTFSFPVIAAANLLIMNAMIIIASPTATFRGFFANFWWNARTFISRIIESGAEMHGWFWG